MLPTYHPGDTVLVCPWLKKSKIGDVIGMFDPKTDRILIKRVTRKEGDLFFVEGDNSNESTDSRTFGMIGKDRILGRVIYKSP